MNAPPLEPMAGFNWAKVIWGRPDSVPSVLCSYCSASLPDDDVPQSARIGPVDLLRERLTQHTNHARLTA
jgi:hypothetical protein